MRKEGERNVQMRNYWFSMIEDVDRKYLEDRKEAGREVQGAQGLSKNCISRENVPPLSRLVRGFRKEYH